MEESVAAGKTLDQEHKEAMRSKAALAAIIDELELAPPTSANRAFRIRPPSVCHRHRLDPLHRSSDFKATKQPTKEHLGHVRKNRLPKSTPRPELVWDTIIVVKTETNAPSQQTTRLRCPHPPVFPSWPAERRCPQGGERRKDAFVARSSRSEVSFRNQSHGKEGHTP
ncbi:hypothetical protein D1007_02591 [Hordeum vulgare]|nr:hypothetical protein D1007_02591 [Hordeum vulgare]